MSGSRTVSTRQVGLTLLRVVPALLFMQHGAQKLFGLLGGAGPEGGTVELISWLGLAGVLEFFGGLMLVVGIWTRLVAGILALEMVIAYSVAHAPRGFWPILNGGELALLYLFIFLYVALAGGGPYSLDSRPR